MCTDCGCSPSSQVSAPPFQGTRRVPLEANLLARNQQFADSNRAAFKALNLRAINLLAGPGAGKTTLLEVTLRHLRKKAPNRSLEVIEGDQQTSLDAERIHRTGVPAVQINTGLGCHLDAAMILRALTELHPEQDPGRSHPPQGSDTLLFIENVGNLVCPALWDLGENAKVVIFSVTEGEEKPLKYPDMFAAADLILLSKVDLLPYLSFDPNRALAACRAINPEARVLPISATQGDGLDPWLDWLLELETTSAPRAWSAHNQKARPSWTSVTPLTPGLSQMSAS